MNIHQAPTAWIKLSPEAIDARFGHDNTGLGWQSVMSCEDRTAPRVGTLVVEHGEVRQLVQSMCPDCTAPRVGTLVVEHGEILQLVQSMCPEHVIKHVVLCRGAASLTCRA